MAFVWIKMSFMRYSHLLSLSPGLRVIINKYELESSQTKMKMSKQWLPSPFPPPLPNKMESSILSKPFHFF